MLAGLTIILPGCKKELSQLSSYRAIGNTKMDSIRIYNLLPDLSGDDSNTGYLVYLNDSLNMYTGLPLASGALTYGAIPVLTVPAEGGTFNIKLTKYAYDPYNTDPTLSPPAKHPDTSAIVFQKTITLPPHSGYSNIIFYDSLGKTPAMKLLRSSSADPGAPAPGKFKIRIVNFSYDMTPDQSSGAQYNVQLQYPDSTIVKGDDNIPFAGASDYQEMDYGTKQFLVYNSTTQEYIKNSGPFNDVLTTFDLSPISPFIYAVTNHLFPMIGDYQVSFNNGTIQEGNIGSYPFAPGGCYTVMVIGNMYSVALDRRYGPGVQDNVGKIQVVNANPNQQDMEVKITYSGGQSDIHSLPFGKAADPLTVPVGPVSIAFISPNNTVYTYNAQVPRLGDYTYYYTADNNTLPFVFAQANTIVPTDYIYGSSFSIAQYQLIKLTALDLSPDAGPVFFTTQTNIAQGVDTKLNANQVDATFKNPATQIGLSGANYVMYDGTLPPTAFSVRLSSSRPDSLAGKMTATISPAFTQVPAPGNYTLVAAGLLNTTDPAKKMKLIMVKHTNFISKAQ